MKVYSSLDYSKVGIVVWEGGPPRRNEEGKPLGKTKFIKTNKKTPEGKVKWIHKHEASERYMQAYRQYGKRVCTGYAGLTMQEYKIKRGMMEEQSDNQCAILMARIARYSTAKVIR